MPNRAELQPDRSTLQQVENPGAPQGAPAYPDATPRANPQIRTTLAPIQQMQPDQQRQFFKSGVPQIRISPPPSTANPTINASASGITKRVTDPLASTVSQNTTNVATALQSSFLGPWQPTVQYLANNQVSRNGNTYLSLDTNTNSQPPSADWFLLGPTTMDSLSDGVVNVKNVQYSMANVAIQNAGFEASTSLVSGAPPGWQANSATLSYETGAPYAGSQSLKVAASVTGGGAITSQRWTCVAGQQFFVSAAQKSDGVSSPNTILVFFNSAGTFISGAGASHGTGTSWTVDTGTVTAPAGAVSFYVTCANALSGGGGTCWFDSVLCDRMVNPATTLQPLGSTPYSLSGAFTYTSTPTTVTVSWSGIVIYRSDGTSTSLVNGSQLITGLSAGTFYVYPFYNDLVGGTAPSFIDSMGGAVGTPPICWNATSITLAQAQNLMSRIPLNNGGMAVVVPASGTSGGSGQGGGGGGCFTGNVGFKTPTGLMKFSEAPARFTVKNETGVHEAELLVHEGEWDMIDMGDGELVTLNHLFKAGRDWITANLVFPDNPRVKYAGNVYNLHVRTDQDRDRHYILESGAVVHNFKPL